MLLLNRLFNSSMNTNFYLVIYMKTIWKTQSSVSISRMHKKSSLDVSPFHFFSVFHLLTTCIIYCICVDTSESFLMDFFSHMKQEPEDL